MGKRTGVWVDMGPVSFFDVWYTLSIELLPTGEFKLMAGSYTYTTTTSAPDASVRLKSIILQGHNYDPLVPGAGVTYDIYWDHLAYQNVRVRKLTPIPTLIVQACHQIGFILTPLTTTLLDHHFSGY